MDDNVYETDHLQKVDDKEYHINCNSEMVEVLPALPTASAFSLVYNTDDGESISLDHAAPETIKPVCDWIEIMNLANGWEYIAEDESQPDEQYDFGSDDEVQPGSATQADAQQQAETDEDESTLEQYVVGEAPTATGSSLDASNDDVDNTNALSEEEKSEEEDSSLEEKEQGDAEVATLVNPGHYIVGEDIPAGSYTITIQGDQTWLNVWSSAYEGYETMPADQLSVLLKVGEDETANNVVLDNGNVVDFAVPLEFTPYKEKPYVTPTPTPTSAPTPTPTTDIDFSYYEYECYSIAEEYMKNLSWKNPASLMIHGHTTTFYDEGYTFFIDYSAQNGFGGYCSPN